MSRPDFVEFVLDTLEAGWDTSTFDPRPTLIDRRDSSRRDGAPRSREFDLSNNNTIGVGSQPTATNEPIGTGYDYRFIDGVQVRLEAVHSDEHGHVDDAADYVTLQTELQRAINEVRVSPTSDPDVCALRITEVNDQSSEYRDYFRTDYRVEFRGFEDLP